MNIFRVMPKALFLVMVLNCSESTHKKTDKAPANLVDAFLQKNRLYYLSDTGYKSEYDGFIYEFDIDKHCNVINTDYQGESQSRLRGGCKRKGKEVTFTFWLESGYDKPKDKPTTFRVICQYQPNSDALIYNEHLKCNNHSKVMPTEFPKGLKRVYQDQQVTLSGFKEYTIPKETDVFERLIPVLRKGRYYPSDSEGDTCEEPGVEARSKLSSGQKVHIIAELVDESNKQWYLVDVIDNICENPLWIPKHRN